jgi:hypothetical protein
VLRGAAASGPALAADEMTAGEMHRRSSHAQAGRKTWKTTKPDTSAQRPTDLGDRLNGWGIPRVPRERHRYPRSEPVSSHQRCRLLIVFRPCQLWRQPWGSFKGGEHLPSLGGRG